ncbi:unnamed protein product, partial [Choristocarpus tenellus]
MLLLARKVAGSVMRQLGKGIDRLGGALETHPYQEKLVPSTRILVHKGKTPEVPQESFIAPNASVIGDVKMGPGSSVWYGSVVRGDVNSITIGAGTAVGDAAVVHVAGIAGNNPTIIGSNVIVG